MSPQNTTIDWHRDEDGVVVLTLDDPTQSVNTMTSAFVDSLEATLDRIDAEKDDITGVILTSAKSTFFAGGDLNDLRAAKKDDLPDLTAFVERNRNLLRRLETLGVPVVSAINGAALGGGLEIALATHRRIAVDSPKVVVGLPEVTLGLLPGAGGVVRAVRLLGIQPALQQLLLQGQRHRAAAALELGVLDELVATADDLVPAAKAWIAANPDAVQPWDVKGHRIPGGAPSDPKIASLIPALPPTVRKQLKGANYPAPTNILAAAIEGARVDFDNALVIETRYFLDLVTGPVAKNMIQTFFDLQETNGARGRTSEGEPWKATKLVVLGAGMMGAAIAYVSAKAGIEVVLKDVSQEAADRGKAYSEKLVAKGIKRGSVTQEKGDALLGRILATTRPEDAKGADIVIEAVFEDPKVKEQVFAEIEPFLAPDALLGSNTSTLPITGLAEYVSRPADFIGLHFFSPVDKMPLLEIIKGEKTTDATLSKALDFSKQISKTPIVVNDSRGFFTSRVIGTFIYEGLAILNEGVPAPSVEQATSQAGYPAPVLQLSDELNLDLMRRVRDQNIAGAEAAGREWVPHPGEVVIDRQVDEFDRRSRLQGKGFYEYDEAGRRVGLWSGLKEAYGGGNTDMPFEDMKERMLFAEAIETVKCRDEGVIESVADANVGSILGIGFPAWTGGVLQFINNYDGGVAGFVARAEQLAERYGARFTPPASLVAVAEAGATLVDLEPAAATA